MIYVQIKISYIKKVNKQNFISNLWTIKHTSFCLVNFNEKKSKKQTYKT